MLKNSLNEEPEGRYRAGVFRKLSLKVGRITFLFALSRVSNLPKFQIME